MLNKLINLKVCHKTVPVHSLDFFPDNTRSFHAKTLFSKKISHSFRGGTVHLSQIGEEVWSSLVKIWP